MKFIHCSDIHLDSPMDTHFTAQQAARRNTELLQTFVRMAAYAKEQGVTGVLLCGDLFDTARVSRKTVSTVLSCITAAEGVDFLYLPGNHDQSDPLTDFAPLPSNLKCFDEDWTYYTYDNVTIAGARQPGSSAPVLPETGVNLVMLHGQVGSAAGEDLVCLPALKNKHVDYLALGHLHSYQTGALDTRGSYAYSGCLEGRGFDECGEKGFILLETAAHTITHSFVPFAARRFHSLSVDISRCTTVPELLSAITAACGDMPTSDMVKVTLTGTYTPHTQKDLHFLQTMLQDRFYFIKCKDNSRLYIDPADYLGDISLKGEFVRTVLASDLDQEEKDRIICLGLAALQGETIVL